MTEEQKYFANEGVSQSQLKVYLKHPKTVFKILNDEEKDNEKELYENEDTAFTKGNLVDIRVTNVDAEKIIAENYIVIDDVEISDKKKEILKSLRDRLMMIYNDVSDLDIKLTSTLPVRLLPFCMNDVRYYNNRSIELYDHELVEGICDYHRALTDTRVKGFIEDKDCEKYFQNLLKRSNIKKIPVSSRFMEESHVAATACLTNPTYIKFVEEADKILYQSPYYSKHTIYDSDEDVMIPFNTKILRDIVLINEKKKLIRIIDIKTTSVHLSQFFSVIRRLRYDIQAAYYTHFTQEEYGQDWDVEFYNLAVSYNDPTYSEMFKYTPRTLKLATIGSPKHYILGWHQLFNRMYFYQKYGYVNTPEYILNGGFHNVDLYQY